MGKDEDLQTRQMTRELATAANASAGPVFVLSVQMAGTAPDPLRLDGTQAGAVLVGSSEACHLRIADPTVSRRHLSLEVKEGGLVVTDLDARNGTRIAGVRIREAFIDTGAAIELGAVTLVVARDDSARAALPPAAEGFGGVVGASLPMRRLYPLCARLAQATIPVVIEGETGTGKEAMAEALHEQGPRRDGPFVVFDCTAVAANLLEAELFGHEKGAFTGADRAREGVFAQADGGTLFIDEIGDMDLPLQSKLLRAIDRGEIRPIGSARTTKVDVRIIAATRRDLDREVQTGRFRDDLFHRLAIGRLELPPLRKRHGDISLLARHFFEAMGGARGGLPAAMLARWEADPWPGNVRELRNAIARYLALGELAEMAARADAEDAKEGAPDLLDGLDALPLSEARARVVERFERQYIARVLARTGGNVTAAAAHAGVARRYFHLLKAKLG